MHGCFLECMFTERVNILVTLMQMLIECSHISDQCMIKSSFLYLGHMRRIHVFTVNHKIIVIFAFKVIIWKAQGVPQ